MNQTISVKKNKQSKIVFGISVLTLALVLLFQTMDIYKNAVVGVLFEFFWIFIIAAVFVIPIIAIWGLIKNNFSIKSFYFLTFLISILSLILLFK